MGEQLLGKFKTAEMRKRRRQRRPGEHRRARRGNFPARAAKAFHQHVTPALIKLAVLRDDILRPVDRSDSGRMDRRACAVIQIAFHPAERRAEIGRASWWATACQYG